jgi:hypothetical protein
MANDTANQMFRGKTSMPIVRKLEQSQTGTFLFALGHVNLALSENVLIKLHDHEAVFETFEAPHPIPPGRKD